MKLIEALTLVQARPRGGPVQRRIGLACGFTPTPLATFLAAHLRLLDPATEAVVEPGLFGECLGTLDRLPGSGCEAAVCVIEWPDLDPRLGYRQLGGWSPADLDDVLRSVPQRAEAFAVQLRRVAKELPLALSLPSLELPPVGHTVGWQSSRLHAELRAGVASLAVSSVDSPGIKLLDPEALGFASPLPQRRDARNDLLSGSPYSLAHASALAGLLARLLSPPPPLKGLVTDLDDTLWLGLLGEEGPQGVEWSLDGRAQMHGVYQQLLRALADSGVLVAACSKNDPVLVAEALARSDVAIPVDRFFPMEAGWGAKSEAIARILRAWNVDAASVAFVDDSPMELAEVAAAHPGLRTLRFPTGDENAIVNLLRELRDLFGRPRLGVEDTIRRESLLSASHLRANEGSGADAPEPFLQDIGAEIDFSFAKDPPLPRALELVNKTNQFNLNGERFSEGAWLAELRRPGSFLLQVSYRDKFGPLGVIAVLMGRAVPRSVQLQAWVMSCRAFSRRIEYRCLERLFESFGAQEVELAYRETPRNAPLREFLGRVGGGPASPGMRISRSTFDAASRGIGLYHCVSITGG